MFILKLYINNARVKMKRKEVKININITSLQVFDDKEQKKKNICSLVWFCVFYISGPMSENMEETNISLKLMYNITNPDKEFETYVC